MQRFQLPIYNCTITALFGKYEIDISVCIVYFFLYENMEKLSKLTTFQVRGMTLSSAFFMRLMLKGYRGESGMEGHLKLCIQSL